MKGFLAGVGAASVLFALTSFAYWSGRSEAAAAAAPAVARTGGVVLRDLPLYRGFQAVVPLTQVPSGAFEMSTLFPPNLGAAITHVSFSNSGSGILNELQFRIDGTDVARRALLIYSGQGTNADFDFDPPLVVPPGRTFGICATSSSPYPITASIGGWVLFPGDV